MSISRIKHHLSLIKPIPNNRPKAASVMLLLCNNPLEIVFTVRSQSLNNHRGQVSFPGGKQDDGESLIETAVRETKEEIGIEDIEVLGRFYNVNSKAKDTYVSTIVGYKQQVCIKDMILNPDEVSKAFLVPIKDLVCQRQFGIHTFYIKSHVIWGLTGYLTSTFISDIYLKK